MHKKPVPIKKLYAFTCILFILLAQASFSQNKKDTGLIIFRSELYFVKTTERSLENLFSNKIDTINAWSLGVPGDDAGNVKSFQDYLTGTLKLDTATYLTNLANNYDLYIEGFKKFYWTYGYIEYLENESYKVTTNYTYTTIINNSKRIILKVISDTHLQSFTPLRVAKKTVAKGKLFCKNKKKK